MQEEENAGHMQADLEQEELEPRLRDTPEDISFEAAANTIAFHPSQDILAAGDVDGDVYVYSYSCLEGGNRELWSSGHHLKSCREVSFSHDGQKLFTVSKDKSIHILNVEEGRLVTRFSKAHSSALNSLLVIDDHLFATGDDGGMLKVWDLRKGTAIMEMRQHEEYISSMAIDENKKLLLTTSGDGTMGVFNIKRRRFELLSEPQSGDLTSIALMKRGKKVVCGSSEGTIYLFNWDGFGATSDRFAVKAESVDCMVPVTENVLCTGSIDGVIRAVNILPNRVIGSVGQHLGEPIEQLAKSHTGQLLASTGHDQKVKFWDISSLCSMVVDDYRKRKKSGQLKALSCKALGGREDFFADMREVAEAPKEEQEEESDSDDSE
ncbi:WD repeat-containing protein 55 [Dermochelys coriacea]|uniref:WD repeat-containing protein 55 n=1 Tax=Dermochelys coriacea TaxID=27794 RepID=UPI0018E7916C|nr:WD repeat-containing protein 55 [Dermochelys coriacea]XP_038270363.1 WD repeat-containing protein 55 [Dermochelys coriacea]XP_043376135.1 WD repeat-containing protein 55 [Dermochelys coriacea]